MQTVRLTDLLKGAERFTVANSPAILTAVGVAGVVTTGVLAFRGGLKASDILAEEWLLRMGEDDKFEELTLVEKVTKTWQCYTPACGVGLLTIGAVIGANRIGTRRTVAMAAAFSLTEKAYEEYRETVQEKFGKKKSDETREETARKRVNKNGPTEENTVIVTNGGDQIFQDSWSGRYFKSTMESVQQAVNQLNHVVNMEGQASLTDFYELLGLTRTAESDELGWKAEKLLDVYFDAVMHDAGNVPVIAMEYRVTPSRDYFQTR